MRAGIALGSNVGDRLENLKAARKQIGALRLAEEPILASSIYETEPVGCKPGDPAFLNAALEIGWLGEPLDLLHELRQIEANCGRPAAHEKNAPRTLDLDLLYFGEATISTPELELPHPRVCERRFELEPLAEIRPNLILPGQRQTVAELLRAVPQTTPLVRIACEW